MVKIRLARHGAKKRPFYRIVVADSRSPRDGRFLERIGSYDPTKNPAVVEIKQDKLNKWLQNGARPTEIVAQLIKKVGKAPES
jgi:small subunit ribosomal protein S16